MKARSAKNKGDRFQRYIVERLRKTIDPHAAETKASGAGLDKGDVYCPSVGLVIEAKNASKVNLVKDFEQAESQVHGDNTGVLMIRNPKQAEFKQTFVVMDMEDWLEMQRRLLSTDQVEKVQEKNSEISRELKYALRRLEVASKKILKLADDAQNSEFNYSLTILRNSAKSALKMIRHL